jgi:ferredoxin-NADP reductase
MNRAYRSGLRKEGYADGVLREVRVAEVRRETPTAVTVVLADGQPFDFRPGQFFTVVTEVDGRPVRRAYSASSAPGADRLEVTVKLVDGGRFSTHVHRRLRAGDRLALRGPSGTFHPPASAGIVLVAAGSGITPMMSMIRTRLAGPDRGRIDLLYSSRDETEIIFGADLDRLAAEHPDRLSVTHVSSRRDGRIDADGIRRWVTGSAPDPAAHYYVCGPEALTGTVRAVLTGLGVPAGQVHSERFLSGPDTVTTEPQEMTVTENGRLVGTAVVAPGQTLLDAGLAAGLPLPYSCTVGGCGSCTVHLTSGDVTQTEPDGTVLACVSCPLSAVRLDIRR